MNSHAVADAAAAKRLVLLSSPRAAVAVVFFVLGLSLGLWSGASASILQHAGASPSIYGAAMTVFAVIYLIAMSSGGLFSRYFALRHLLLTITPLLGAGTAGLLLAPSGLFIFLGLAVFGFFAGLLDVTMNAEGTRVEHDVGRTVLAGFHACASCGLACGAILGSLIAVEIGEWASALLAIAASALATAVIYQATPNRGLDHAAATPEKGAVLFTRTLVVIGLVVGVSIAGEVAAMTWSATLLQRQAPKLAAIAGLGGGFFAACQACVRFLADGPRRAFGDRQLIIVSLSAAAVGFVIVAADLGFAASVAGFAVVGFGAGAVVPCGFALAVRRSSFSHSAALSTAALFSSIPRVPAPLAMGAIAETVSISAAFGLFAVLLAGAVAAMLCFTEPDRS
jgi:predicted MFS family arabinose efflux permease